MRFFPVAQLRAAESAPEKNARLLFADDFNRTESTPDQEDIGHGWTTNSAWRAPGKKQAALKDGTLVVGTDPTAGHALTLFHPAPLRDGAVEFRFKLPARESIGLEFADPECKTVHAGHLCGVKVSATQVVLNDLKTGAMDLALKQRRTSGKQDPELAALLKTKTKSFPIQLAPDVWHTLRLTAKGDTLSATLDEQAIGSFRSDGIAHPTKKEIRLNIGKSAVLDDVKIWKID